MARTSNIQSIDNAGYPAYRIDNTTRTARGIDAIILPIKNNDTKNPLVEARSKNVNQNNDSNKNDREKARWSELTTSWK
jgi:hypothetical protein